MMIIIGIVVLTGLFFVIGLIGTAAVNDGSEEKVDGNGILVAAFIVAVISMIIAVLSK